MVFSRSDELVAVMGFEGKAGMFFVVFREGSSDGDSLPESSHAGVVDVDVLSDGKAVIGIEDGVDELGGGDLHPLDEDVGAEQVGEGWIEGADSVRGVDGKRFGMGCRSHGHNPWIRCWKS